MQPPASRGLAFTYAIVIFLSAFLLFQVQPLIGKCVLPWFGGSPAVWTTCMLVFQLLLFGGYAYAHLTTRFLTPRQQTWLHSGLLVLALIALPIAPDERWKPTGSDAPTLHIICLLVATIGLPYFILSSTSPLVQGWFSRSHVAQSPYRLYSLSNIGSLLALLSYPFLVEPSLSTDSQASVWSWLFVGFAGVCIVAGWWMVRMLPARPEAALGSSALTSSPLKSTTSAPDSSPGTPSWSLSGLWFGLAMTASILLLSTTNQVCLDVAVVPFLWVLPLALYLITFILCFDSDRWYSRKIFGIAAITLLTAAVWLVTRGSYVPIGLQVAIFFGMMFSCCMVCHGELAALKPHPRFLTGYFLTISAGGAAGGLFVGIVSPILFVSYNELHFGILSFLILGLLVRLREDGAAWPLPAWTQPVAMVGVVGLLLGLLSQVGRHDASALSVGRNFYGILKVQQVKYEPTDELMLELAHGRVTHGSQFIGADKRGIATAYYAESAGIGQLLRQHRTDQPRHIGIVGLGVGTLAAYGQVGDRIRMYEINPAVIDAAEQQFSFLRDCAAEQVIITGDARLSLEFEEPQAFDVLVLDAFSGDAIPVHLLTREAIEVYLKHLRDDGVLACHISNLHFNLKPVIAGLAAQSGLQHVIVESQANDAYAAKAATWAILARSADNLQMFQKLPPRDSLPPACKPIIWTDNRSNLLEVMWQ